MNYFLVSCYKKTTNKEQIHKIQISLGIIRLRGKKESKNNLGIHVKV